MYQKSVGRKGEEGMKVRKRITAMILLVTMLVGVFGNSVSFVSAKETGDILKLSITYHLNSEDGNMIAEPYYADMEEGSSYEVVSPEIENYVLNNTEQKVISGVLNQNTEIKVVYSYDSSNEVDYKINYIGVDSRGNETLLETVTNKEPVNTIVSIPANAYEGYEKRTGQNMQLTVTDDGRAEKNVYYDKVGNTYIIFQTQGSYIDPIMAEAGEDISEQVAQVSEPVREGYEFVGWDREIPTIMPDEDYIVNAKWEPSVAEYTVLYWFENANDDGYTLGQNSEKRTAVVGTEVTASVQDIENGDDDENTLNNEFFGFNYSYCTDTTVSPDGTSVLNVYYDREIWKINYMEKDGITVWKTIEGKYMSLIGDKLIDDAALKEHYGSSFAYMAKTRNGNDAAMLERFENSKSGTSVYGEQNVFPYFNKNLYKFSIRQFSQDANSDREILVNTSYIYYYKNYAYGMILVPPAGFVWDGGYWKTATSEYGLTNAAKKQNPNGTDSTGKATFYNVFQYMDIYMSRVKSTLTYISNGEQISQIQNVPYEKNLDLSLVPDNGEENMKFVGWYYNPILMNSEEPLQSYTMPANDLALYAKWEPVDKVVQFDTQGGNIIDQQIVAYNSKATMPEAPVKEGFVFTGWYTEPDNEERWSFDRPVEKDITLYAHWRPVSMTNYTVKHVIKGQEEPFAEEEFVGGVGDTIVALPLDPKDEKYPPEIYLKPDETSKTMVLDYNDENNVVVFTYIEVALKNYTVKYLNKVTDEPIDIEKSVTTRNTVVTEDAVEIDGFMIYGNSRITSNIKENSEIIFYYMPDKLKVTYQFVSGTEGVELPEEIMKLVPTDENEYAYGDTVTVKMPEKDTVNVTDGVWEFKGYQLSETNFIIEDNITITGVWENGRYASTINRIPEITATDKSYKVGDEFSNGEALKEVTAWDEEDGDVTDRLEVLEHNVDTSVAGKYYITYKVTDSQGASSTKTVNVYVYPLLTDINNIPVIHAENKELYVGDEFDPRKDVTATDIEDGDLTSVIEIVENTVDTSKAGTYYVVYKVTDKDGASSVKTIDVYVKAKEEVTPTVPEEETPISDPNQTSSVEKPEKSAVATGDNADFFIWLSLMTTAGLAVVTIYVCRKTQKKKK